MRDYVLRLIQADQQTPSRDEWLARVRARPRITFDQPVAELIAADRRRRDAADPATAPSSAADDA